MGNETKRPARVASRYQVLLERIPVRDQIEDGVQPLNPGHFFIERARDESHPKERAVSRVRIKGKQ